MLSWSYKILKEAARLDIFDLAFEFSSESLNMLSLGPSALPRKGVIKRILIFFWHFLMSASAKRQTSSIPVGSFVFFVMNKNEQDSLASVFSKVQNAWWIGCDKTSANRLPFFFAHVVSCLYFPLVMLRFFQSKGYRRKSFAYIFDHYLLIYGLYAVCRIWLMRIKPKAVVLSNDVNTHNRVMVKAARDQGIPTFYLQHASVPENFPPLAFDYALLEGYDALHTHTRLGTTTTQVFLVGMPRHDPHFGEINRRIGIACIGICTNGLDPVYRVEELCSSLRREFAGLPLVLRPHLADLRVKAWKELCAKYDLKYSDGRSEHAFDFLKKVDAIIAGDSNILLEAALMNVLPLHYDFSLASLDWYRFQRNGLVQHISECTEMCRTIKEVSGNRPPVRARAKQYCATIGTLYDGRSSDVASALIQQLSSNQTDLRGWKRIPDIDLEAYELSL